MTGKELWPLMSGRFALLLILTAAVLPFAPAGSAWLWWLLLTGGLLVLAGFDWLISPPARLLAVSTEVKGQWVRGEPQRIGLGVANSAAHPVDLLVRQDLPLELGGPAEALPLHLGAGEQQSLSFEATPQVRGDHAAGSVHARWPSRFGLVVKRATWSVSEPVRVYAPLYIDRGPGLVAPRNRTEARGSGVQRVGGVHTEFESLREYRPGDEFRAVNWQATARRGRLVVNEYQAERTQQVMLVLDAGRLMLPEYQGVPRFEYALSAALQLGRVAAEREDHVGLMTFGGTEEPFLLPRRGLPQVTRIAEAAYRVRPQMLEPDYAGALTRLSGSLKRRSLLLFFTDFVSPAVSRGLVEHLLRLAPRHLVAVLAISDPAVTQLAASGGETLHDAYAQAAADWVLEERNAAKAALTQRGIAVIDVPPLELSSAAINKYLAIKKQGML